MARTATSLLLVSVALLPSTAWAQATRNQSLGTAAPRDACWFEYTAGRRFGPEIQGAALVRHVADEDEHVCSSVGIVWRFGAVDRSNFLIWFRATSTLIEIDSENGFVEWATWHGVDPYAVSIEDYTNGLHFKSHDSGSGRVPVTGITDLLRGATSATPVDEPLRPAAMFCWHEDPDGAIAEEPEGPGSVLRRGIGEGCTAIVIPKLGEFPRRWSLVVWSGSARSLLEVRVGALGTRWTEWIGLTPSAVLDADYEELLNRAPSRRGTGEVPLSFELEDRIQKSSRHDLRDALEGRRRPQASWPLGLLALGLIAGIVAAHYSGTWVSRFQPWSWRMVFWTPALIATVLLAALSGWAPSGLAAALAHAPGPPSYSVGAAIIAFFVVATLHFGLFLAPFAFGRRASWVWWTTVVTLPWYILSYAYTSIMVLVELGKPFLFAGSLVWAPALVSVLCYMGLAQLVRERPRRRET